MYLLKLTGIHEVFIFMWNKALKSVQVTRRLNNAFPTPQCVLILINPNFNDILQPEFFKLLPQHTENT